MASAEIIVRFNLEERRYTLNPDIPYGIGRSPQNAICVPSETVSRNHALIKQNEDGAFCIFDLGSRNGTLLNDRLVASSMALRDGDVIGIGEVSIQFAQNQTQSTPPVRPAVSHSTVLTFAVVQLTVLVVDIKGFTSLSRKIGAAKIAEVVQAYNSETGQILDKSGSWTMKFIGDAVMAIWLHKNSESAANTMLTAFRAFEEIYTLVAGVHTQFELAEPLFIGGGINTGYASVGNIGSGSTADYTALGDSVNMAFRLEAATRGLNCDLTFGPEVFAVLRSPLEGSGLAKKSNICLKGYADECEVYWMNVGDVRRLLTIPKTAN